MYDDATRRLETIIKYDQENAEAYYLRGLIEFKKSIKIIILRIDLTIYSLIGTSTLT